MKILRKLFTKPAAPQLECEEKRALAMLMDEPITNLARNVVIAAHRMVGSPMLDEFCTCSECMEKINRVKASFIERDLILARAGCRPSHRVKELLSFADHTVAISVATFEARDAVKH